MVSRDYGCRKISNVQYHRRDSNLVVWYLTTSNQIKGTTGILTPLLVYILSMPNVQDSMLPLNQTLSILIRALLLVCEPVVPLVIH